MKFILLSLIFVSVNALAEVYDSDADFHESVTLCSESKPYSFKIGVYLDRKYIEGEVSVSELIDHLISLDFTAKSYNLDWRPHEKSTIEGSVGFEGTYYEQRLEVYASSNWIAAAKCVLGAYQKSDKVFKFNNRGLGPSKQKGFLVVREGKIVVRLLTHAEYH
ncbi:hypothetical protein [Teredinibacter turnerae]|uniref:hypothetical protein n=1 Tax=Teredinibacter turnerae TaxID=2426 RepID=UPI00048D7BCD|nr:hypothetical protein [Teredinibacter turnerae]